MKRSKKKRFDPVDEIIRLGSKVPHEIGICDDKAEVFIRIRLKIDWKAKRYWLKYVKVDHTEKAR